MECLHEQIFHTLIMRPSVMTSSPNAAMRAFMDAWLPEYVNDTSGNSIMLIRNPEIRQLVDKTKEMYTVLNPIDISRVIKSQASALTTKRAWIHERKRLASSHAQPFPEKSASTDMRPSFHTQRIFSSAHNGICPRNSGRLWMESGRNLKRFNDMSRDPAKQAEMGKPPSQPFQATHWQPQKNWRKKIIGDFTRKNEAAPAGD